MSLPLRNLPCTEDGQPGTTQPFAAHWAGRRLLTDSVTPCEHSLGIGHLPTQNCPRRAKHGAGR